MPGPARAEDRLSLTESVVLALVAEGPIHGFAISRLLEPEAPLGRVYRVSRPIVYRALDRLAAAGLIVRVGTKPGSGGPDRSPFKPTAAGRRTVRAWLAQPATHVRDLRTELLIKLALLDRAGADPRPLLMAQRHAIRPIALALEQRIAESSGFDRCLQMWRFDMADASLRYLDEMIDSDLGTRG